MKFIQGKDWSQTEFFCLEQAVSDDNEVRLIDLFINTVKLSDYGFKTVFINISLIFINKQFVLDLKKVFLTN